MLLYVLVHKVRHVKYLHANLSLISKERNRRHDGNAHNLHVVTVSLPFPSYGHRTSQTVQLITRLRSLSRSTAAMLSPNLHLLHTVNVRTTRTLPEPLLKLEMTIQALSCQN